MKYHQAWTPAGAPAGALAEEARAQEVALDQGVLAVAQADDGEGAKTTQKGLEVAQGVDLIKQKKTMVGPVRGLVVVLGVEIQ